MSLVSTASKLLKNPSGNLWIQVFRYLVSGGTAFVVDFGILAILTAVFGKELLLLWTGIAFCCGLLVTYLFSIFWVFDNRSVSNRCAEAVIFILIGVVGLGFTEFLMWLFAGRMGIHHLISKCITTVTVTAWNFAAKKLLLFRSAPGKDKV